MLKSKEEVEKIAMNIVYQLDDDAHLSVDFRQANNDKRINFVKEILDSLRLADKQEYKRGVIEMLKSIKKLHKQDILNYEQSIDRWLNDLNKNQAIDDIINKLKV